jgi:hypothetical protein
MDLGIVPLQKPVLGQQSGPFGCKNHQGFGQSLLEAPYAIGFDAGLSKLWRRTTLSAILFVIFNVFTL